MMTLHCTHRLLWRAAVTAGPAFGRPGNALGDWYANVIVARGGEYVVAVNERTLLAVVWPAEEPEHMVPAFQRSLTRLLDRLGVPRQDIARELHRMSPVFYAATRRRDVPGRIYETLLQCRSRLRRHDDWHCDETETALAIAPRRVLGDRSPASLASDILARQGEIIDLARLRALRMAGG